MPIPISVVIPTHDRDAYLRLALRSVLRQSHPPHEVLVVDDGAGGSTARVVRDEAVRCDVRVDHIVRRGNAGAGASRRLGTEMATGDYVAYLDDDDLWLPGHLEQIAASAQATEPLVIAVPRVDVTEDGFTVLGVTPVLIPESSFEMFALDAGFGGSNIACKREVLQTLPWRDLQRGEDRDLLVRLLDAGYSVEVLERATVLVREHGGDRLRDTVRPDPFLEQYRSVMPLPARWHRRTVQVRGLRQARVPARVLGVHAWVGSLLLASFSGGADVREIIAARRRRKGRFDVSPAGCREIRDVVQRIVAHDA